MRIKKLLKNIKLFQFKKNHFCIKIKHIVQKPVTPSLEQCHEVYTYLPSLPPSPPPPDPHTLLEKSSDNARYILLSSM